MKQAVEAGNKIIRKQLINDLEKAIGSEDTKKADVVIEKFLASKTNRLEQLNQMLIEAFDSKKPKVIEYLIAKGAEINSKKDGSLMTPIFEAAIKNDLAWFEKILTKMNQETKAKLLNSRDANGETILFVLLKQAQPNINLIEFITKNGAETNDIENRYGQSLAELYKQKIAMLGQSAVQNSNSIDIRKSQELTFEPADNKKEFGERPPSGNSTSSRSKNSELSLRLSTEESSKTESTLPNQQYSIFSNINQFNKVALVGQNEYESSENSDEELMFKID